MSWIAGIDYSTFAVDVVLVDEDDARQPEWIHYDLKGDNAFDRARLNRSDVSIGNDLWYVHGVGIEDPRGKGSGKLYRIQGAILGRLSPLTMVHPLIPSQWRKLVGLSGHASKAEIATEVLVQEPDAAYDWSQDACDAYCIAVATRTLIERGKAS